MTQPQLPAPFAPFHRTLTYGADRTDNDYRVRFEAAADGYRRVCDFHRESDRSPAEALASFGGEQIFTKCTFNDYKRVYSYIGALRAFDDAVVSIEVEVPPKQWTIRVATDDEAVIERWTERIQQSLPRPVPMTKDEFPINLWNRSPGGSFERATRWLPRLAWPEMEANYPDAVRPALDVLQRLDRPPAQGRLVLLSGAPGTGKTTFLRSLFATWSSWCRAELIIDPEAFFGDPNYMNKVLLADDGSTTGVEKGTPWPTWRALVIEDGEEFLLSDAKARVGQGLSRMLGLTDGLLGDGLDVLIVITTNVDRHDLHPALVRAGRCLARIDVPPFSAAEAGTWLARHGQPDRKATDGMTLADLYECGDPSQILVEPEPEPRAGYA